MKTPNRARLKGGNKHATSQAGKPRSCRRGVTVTVLHKESGRIFCRVQLSSHLFALAQKTMRERNWTLNRLINEAIRAGLDQETQNGRGLR